jgi:outer membrane beta-barrel protein
MTKQLACRLISAISLSRCALGTAIAVAIIVSPKLVYAQDSGADAIENLFNKEDQEAPPATSPGSGTSTATTGATPAPGAAAGNPAGDSKKIEVNGVTDLQKLSDFKDIAVIQRRYLPKTGRYEVFGGGMMALNDPFFLDIGLNLRFAYYFRERYGIEFVGSYLNSSERSVTQELHDSRHVQTQSLITPNGYLGLDFKWAPVYGKMTFLNRSITPFDLYFSFGVGETLLNQGGDAPTLHLGTGQIFARTKSSAWRWDFSWNFFVAQSNVSSSSGNSLYNNLFITLGYSYFFPEATYR